MIYDISPLVSEEIAVWPGDVPFSRSWQMKLADGNNLDLSSVVTTVHVGAHADAPSHYRQGAKTIDQVDIEPYWGQCWVVTVPKCRLIEPEHCKVALARGAKRVLFKTGSQPDPRHFNTDFTAFSPAAIRALGSAGVRLIGIDTPSVDPFDSKELPAHQELFRFDMRNLEGLVLDEVPDGCYELVAIPLKLRGFDASPVRAILRS